MELYSGIFYKNISGNIYFLIDILYWRGVNPVFSLNMEEKYATESKLST